MKKIILILFALGSAFSMQAMDKGKEKVESEKKSDVSTAQTLARATEALALESKANEESRATAAGSPSPRKERGLLSQLMSDSARKLQEKDAPKWMQVGAAKAAGGPTGLEVIASTKSKRAERLALRRDALEKDIQRASPGKKKAAEALLEAAKDDFKTAFFQLPSVTRNYNAAVAQVEQRGYKDAETLREEVAACNDLFETSFSNALKYYMQSIKAEHPDAPEAGLQINASVAIKDYIAELGNEMRQREEDKPGTYSSFNYDALLEQMRKKYTSLDEGELCVPKSVEAKDEAKEKETKEKSFRLKNSFINLPPRQTVEMRMRYELEMYSRPIFPNNTLARASEEHAEKEKEAEEKDKEIDQLESKRLPFIQVILRPEPVEQLARRAEQHAKILEEHARKLKESEVEK